MDGTSFFSIIIFSGIIALAIVVGVVSLKFFPKTSLTKAIYVVLGCISLILGVIGIFLPILPTTPFLLLTLYSFAKGSSRLEQWFLGTKLYQKHLKSFNERRALTKKSKNFYSNVFNHNAFNWLLFYPKRCGANDHCHFNCGKILVLFLLD